MFRVSVVLSVMVSATVSAQSRKVALCAPPPLREAFVAEITAQGRVAIDLSEMETALYGETGGKESLAAGKPVTLPSTLPKEVRADFAKGEAACRARPKQGAAARRACAEHLVCAVWERHLERLGVERAIEIRAYSMIEGALEIATYEPGDVTIAGFVIPTPGSPAALAKELVPGALGGTWATIGTRPSTKLLPGPKAPPPAALSQGAPQSLRALELPKDCAPAPSLVIEPASPPLAITIAALWRTTVAGQAREGAEPLNCTLELEGEGDRPDSVQFRCTDSEMVTMGLFGSTQFSEPAFQAAVAELFVASELRRECGTSKKPDSR